MKYAVMMVLAGTALAGCATEPPSHMKLDNLLQQALVDEFIADREVVVSYVELPPNTTMDWHWHPGEEFQYYLDGKVEIAIEGRPSIIGVPGEVGHVPFRAKHTAITGPEGARLVVFRVHTAGEPVRYLLEGGHHDH